MAHVSEDRVRETTTTTGTGAVTLAGAATGFRAFSSVMTSPSDTCYYAISSASGSEWEVGLGTYSAANTLTRTTVLRSSNANAAVSLSAGTKDVYITLPSQGTLIENPDGTVTLPSLGTSAPSTPATGNLALFARSLAGRQMPASVGPSGLDSVLQPGLMRNRVCWFSPMAGSATLTGTNGFLIAATGTATAKTPASTSLHTQTAGVDFLVTTAATTAVAGFRSSVAQFWRGNAAGFGGFTYVCRFSPATGVSTSSGTDRCWVGLVASTSAPTDVQPSSLTSMVGVGYDSADANWQVMGNDGSGTAGKYDTGIAVPTTDRPGVYEVAMFAPPNGSSITVTFTDVGAWTSFTQVITASADLPPSTTFMCPKGYHSAGGTSTVTGMTLFSIYVETDL